MVFSTRARSTLLAAALIAAVAGRLRAMIGRAHARASSAPKMARATSPKSRARALSTDAPSDGWLDLLGGARAA